MFLGKVNFAKLDASLSNSYFSIHTTFCLSFIQSYFNTLIHIQFADESSFLPVDTSFFSDLHLFGPVYMVKYLLPVSAASK